MNTMNQQEPILNYNSTTRRWEGQDSTQGFAVWMDDATFQHQVWEYLSAQRIYQPTLGDLEKARNRCRALSYWRDRRDSNIHVTPL
jgi:hypothetical protein